uniref:DUF885 domain-containing protein n=1 Tax=Chromera velia CCMP2878 TaxID=1169474 RepID=A0A0G4HXV5_9ALVE|mmetsp:Transcript_53632/g.104868  ORF Transcript_53632/g.104868 Transcript_53632/m.104868 type:complete len:675 (+) Transcript_53632:123-2147(+)|eukprot:Cvel_9363.t1-p1 / transcript=Cvel_9363.t1 / gene=Cvel_9363 / organism=Chromera_velia_CCMP2878 / gene_product=hypothetical protein / transcript_product=hypothetical protein / location=Cvel_scaffold537:63666-70095(-) / protein_length=674 / sequence_SO=supercontig / SO=protein_coding / is_pseudo=false
MLAAFAIAERLYGTPTAVFVEALISAIRGSSRAPPCVAKFKAGSELVPADFPHVAEVSGLCIEETGKGGVGAVSKVAASLVAPETEGATPLPPPPTYKDFFDRVALRSLANSPEMLTDKRVLSPFGITSYNAFLDLKSFTEEHWRRQFALARIHLDELKAIPTKPESAEEEETAEVIRFSAQTALEFEKEDCFFCEFPANQMFGRPFMNPMIFSEIHPMEKKEDAETYVSRLRQAAEDIADIAKYVRVQTAKDLAMPQHLCDKVTTNLKKSFVEAEPEKSPYLAGLEAASFDCEEEKKEAIQIIKDNLTPAYADLVAAVEESKPKGSAPGKPPGLARLGKRGIQYYKATLRQQTTLALTPQEIHETGLRAVREIRDAMDEVVKKHNLGEKGEDAVAYLQRVNELKEDSRFFYGSDEKDKALADFEKMVSDLNALTKPRFNILPKQPCQVKPVQEHMAAGAPAAFYWPPALDGSRDGAFFANVHDVKMIQKFEMRTLTAHEAVPGHHFQLALAAENKSLHMVRRLDSTVNLNAFWEGWALYAEKLAGECGYYDSDPHDLLGHYGDALFRAARLVVDTALHGLEEPWTREQCVDFMRTNTMCSEKEVDVEIDRYIIMPAQACGYYLGKLAVEKAKAEFKESGGSEVLFHDSLLMTCGLPLEVLPKVLRRAVTSSSA